MGEKRKQLAIGLLATALAIGFTGCAPSYYWARADTGQAGYDSDMARCQYEAASSTATYGSSAPVERTLGGAIGQGLGLGIGQAMAQNNLNVLCMRAKGYSQVPIGTPNPYPVATSEQRSPSEPRSHYQPVNAVSAGATPAVAGLNVESKWILNAESAAKAAGCQGPRVGMTSKGAGEESFAAGCVDGTSLAVRCSYDGCKVLK